MKKARTLAGTVVTRAGKLAGDARSGVTRVAANRSRAINSDPETMGEPRTVHVFGNNIALGRPNSATWALGAVTLLVLIAILLVGGRGANGQTEDTKTEVKRGVVEVTTTGTGSIESARDTDLNFETDGTVTEVFVKEGDRVKKGEAIAKVDRRSARLAVEVAKANLDDLENGVSTSSTTGVSYDSGSSTTDASGSGASGSAATTNAVYTGEVSTQTVAIYTDSSTQATTGDTGVVCADDETKVTDPDTGEVTCEATGPTGATGVTGPTGPAGGTTGGGTVPSTGGGTGTTPETAVPSGTGASTGGLSGGSISGGTASGGSTGSSVSDTDIKSAKLDLAEARETYRNTILRAPFSGTIVSLEGAVGDTASAGSSSSASSSDSSTSSDSALGATSASGSANSSSSSSSAFAVIQQLHSLEMSIDVPEADINDVKNGQRATVTVSSADDEQLAAKVINVGLLADTSSDVVTYPVTVRVQSGSSKVRPGMSASVSIVTDQASGAINVPNQAVTGNSVKVENSDGDAETVTVETGLVGDSSTQILSGLKVGDTVLIPQTTVSSSGFAAGGLPGGASGGGIPSGASGGGFPSGGGIPSGGGFPSGGPPGS